MRQEKWAEVRIAFDPKSNGRHSNDLNNTEGVVVAKPDLILKYQLYWQWGDCCKGGGQDRMEAGRLETW